jgi:hypothetical protein
VKDSSASGVQDGDVTAAWQPRQPCSWRAALQSHNAGDVDVDIDIDIDIDTTIHSDINAHANMFLNFVIQGSSQNPSRHFSSLHVYRQDKDQKGTVRIRSSHAMLRAPSPSPFSSSS